MSYEVEPIPHGIARLYCPTCRTETKVNWVGKMAVKRCWKCDAMLEEKSNDRS